MSGYNTNGLTAASVAAGTLPFTGSETVALDTNLASGVSPQQESVTLAQLVGVQAPVALTDATTIATDASLGHTFSVTLGGNRTLGNPTNLTVGRTYRWEVTQDGTGSRTLAYGSLFKWAGGTAPTLTTTAARLDVITGYYDGTRIIGTSTLDVR